jgi:iron complex transport system permease protein
LGIKPWRVRIVIFSLVAVLTGASVYAGGLISFVGLLSPHLARRLYGNNIKVLLVSSTLIGATITLMSDQFARLILSPSEMPIGLATTILGAPVMMMLAFKIR